jgi:tetratricopeptide (TPR) repeat protein
MVWAVDRAVSEAEALIEMERARDAVELLTKLTDEHPETADAFRALAYAHCADRHLKLAQTAAERAAALAPDDVRTHAQLAAVLIDLRCRKRALEHALITVRLRPADAQSYVILAEALFLNRDRAGAYHAAVHATQLDPDSAWAHMTLARVCHRIELPHKARAAALEASRLEPDDPDAFMLLASANFKLGQEKAAIEAIESAHATAPRDQRPLRAVLALGDDSKALDLLSPDAQQTVADHRRRDTREWRAATKRRLRPARPWWARHLFTGFDPRNGLLMNIAVVTALTWICATTEGDFPGGLAAWAAVLALNLPFSTVRAYRWWRIWHPPSSSWVPPELPRGPRGNPRFN